LCGAGANAAKQIKTERVNNPFRVDREAADAPVIFLGVIFFSINFFARVPLRTSDSCLYYVPLAHSLSNG
jgi:hypothetical protein